MFDPGNALLIQSNNKKVYWLSDSKLVSWFVEAHTNQDTKAYFRFLSSPIDAEIQRRKRNFIFAKKGIFSKSKK